MSKRILLLSAYDAMSHRYWRQGLVNAFPEYDWTILTLPPRYFSWRIRGNSLTWAFSKRELLSRPHDLLIATSMTDLATLRGLVPSLVGIPSLAYFHENQFVYPESSTKHPRIEHQIVNLYTALASDWIVFNSEFNRQTFLEGVRALLNKMPDGVPGGITEQLRLCSETVPVPLENSCFDERQATEKYDKFTLVWNHRWEYDKAPERFLKALLLLKEGGFDFRVHIIGQQFKERPPVFSDMQILLRDHIGEWGMIREKAHYRAILRQSHTVISTALHEFQGIAVLEAVASGCIPVVPDRLAYREFFSAEFRYPTYADNADKEAEVLAEKLKALLEAHRRGMRNTPPDISELSWQNLRHAVNDSTLCFS